MVTCHDRFEQCSSVGIELVPGKALTAWARKHVFNCTVEIRQMFHDLWMVNENI